MVGGPARSQQNSSENAAIKRYAVCTGAEKGHDTAHSPPITSGHVKRGILLRPPWSAANEKEELKKWAGYKNGRLWLYLVERSLDGRIGKSGKKRSSGSSSDLE